MECSRTPPKADSQNTRLDNISQRIEAMLRRIVERLCRWKVVRRRLPNRCGSRQMFISPDSALQYLKPNLESSNAELFDVAFNHVLPGDCVWDIGANVGMFTFPAANAAGAEGQVLAIEADPFLASLLQRSAHLKSNADLRIHVLCAAASHGIGIERLLIAERGR